MNQTHYEKLEQSLKRLKEQYANYKLDKKSLSAMDKEAIKESVIHRFEICNDTLWKHLKKHLRDQEGLIDLPNSPNGVFRQAFLADVIDKKTFTKLIAFNNLRVAVAHDYSLIKAKQALNKIEDFIQYAENIYQILTKK